MPYPESDEQFNPNDDFDPDENLTPSPNRTTLRDKQGNQPSDKIVRFTMSKLEAKLHKVFSKESTPVVKDGKKAESFDPKSEQWQGKKGSKAYDPKSHQGKQRKPRKEKAGQFGHGPAGSDNVVPHDFDDAQKTNRRNKKKVNV